jgi:hypothetical protein
MVNPYLCYAVSFSVAIVAYLFGWSELYPALSTSLLLFLLATIVIHMLAGIRVSQKRAVDFRPINFRRDSVPVIITVFLFVLWGVECWHGGGIPLLKILLRQPYDYKIFGIPTVHVFLVTFSSFFTVLLFQSYLSNKNRLMLVLYLINLSAALLIYNRGMLFFNLTASASLYLVYKKSLPVKEMVIGGAGLVILLFVFGLLGSLRGSNESRNKAYSNQAFLKTGRASASFRNSPLPSEFFWSYIYLTSPIANLQNNVNHYQPGPITFSKVLDWLNNEVLFDFISKRINWLSGNEREPEINIKGPFNASSVYSRSFSYLGWTGLLLMAVVIVVTPLIFYKILPPTSPFFLTGLSILNTMFLFMVFDNTIRFTGLSFQIVYPILLHVATKQKFTAKYNWLT